MSRIVFEDTEALATFLYRFTGVAEDWETYEEICKGIHEFIEAFVVYNDKDFEEEDREIRDCIFPVNDTFVRFNFKP